MNSCALCNTKSQGLQNVLAAKLIQPGMLCVQVDESLSLPYGKQHMFEQVFYFCPNRQCFAIKPKWSNVKAPYDIISEDLDHDDVASWKAKLCGCDSN